MNWQDQPVIVAATGPSLTEEVVALCAAARSTHRIIAVNDAYKVMPFADVLYSCDAHWWNVHDGARSFGGQRWSSQGEEPHNNKAHCAKKFGLRLIDGVAGEGFSFTPGRIHYGNNSGFQACNLALVWGATRLVLVGFNMQLVAGKRHFFGDHPRPINKASPYHMFLDSFRTAAKLLPAHITIINATPDSALTAFPMMPLARALGFVEADAA